MLAGAPQPSRRTRPRYSDFKPTIIQQLKADLGKRPLPPECLLYRALKKSKVALFPSDCNDKMILDSVWPMIKNLGTDITLWQLRHALEDKFGLVDTCCAQGDASIVVPDYNASRSGRSRKVNGDLKKRIPAAGVGFAVISGA